ncbi:MAG: hypothetical protein ACI90V_012029 [Bacillariaceae sp.]|jgi:hypothetical protein
MISSQDEKIASSSSSSSSITTIGLLSLPPDVWSECLSYLPPNELSQNSQLICKNLSGKEVAERAAWITIKSIVGVAHSISRVITTKIEGETTATTTTTTPRIEIEIDTEAIEVQRLLLNDRTIIGDVIRESSNSSSNNNTQMDQKDRGTSGWCGDIFRFQDETWEDLYALVHYVLSTNRNDHESYALVIGLIFNSPALPKRLTDQKRQKLASIARDYSSYISNRGATPENNNNILSNARYSLISLRLGSAGLWEIASNILQSHSSSATTGDPASSCSVLSIDSMIYSSTFLIDRLYSHTYVRKNNEDDINDLVNAVRIGRTAVEMAKKRYDIFYEKQIVATSCEEDKSRCMNEDDQNDHLLLPRPPIESLFANDAFRYVHARLALAKAVTLLAQHIGLGATDIRSINIQQLLPGTITEEDIMRVDGYMLRQVQCYNYAMHFINEAFEQYIPIQSTFRLNKKYWSCQSVSDVISLKAAAESSNGEFSYCSATIASALEINSDLDSDISPPHEAKKSIEQFANAFRLLMFRILRKNIYFDDKVAEIIIRCAKDLGKVCSFAQERIGRQYIGTVDLCDMQGRNIDPGMFHDVAYIFSIYQNGSYHPTSKNIKELDRRKESDIGTISDRYNRIVPWLITEYYNNDGGMTWIDDDVIVEVAALQ